MYLDPPTHYRQIADNRDKVNMDLTPKITHPPSVLNVNRGIVNFNTYLHNNKLFSHTPHSPLRMPDPGLRSVLSRCMQNVHGALTRCVASIFTVEASFVLVETIFVILFFSLKNMSVDGSPKMLI